MRASWFSLLFFCLVFFSIASSQTENECKCILNNLYLDVYVVVDISAQMGTAGLQNVAANINSVFGYSQIRVGDHYADKRGVRVGLITYFSYSNVIANLSTFQSPDELTQAVYDLKPVTDYTSNLQSPLKTIQYELLNYKDANAPRNNTKTVVLIYAADYRDFDEPTISQLGDQLKQEGVIIITMADITRNDHYQIGSLGGLASPGNDFNINDDYPSEEVQGALCRANCFCPKMYEQFVVNKGNSSQHAYGVCVRYVKTDMSWTKAKLRCQNLHRQGYLVTEFSAEKHDFNTKLFDSEPSETEPYKYHLGLHFVNGGYFWEQPVGMALVPLSDPLYPVTSNPPATLQCIGDVEEFSTGEEQWKNINCFNDIRASLCEVAACDTENFCA